jgi:hypothetical protein
MIENEAIDLEAAIEHRHRRRLWIQLMIGKLAMVAGALWLALLLAFVVCCACQDEPRNAKERKDRDARIG